MTNIIRTNTSLLMDRLNDYISELGIEGLVGLHNTYCEKTHNDLDHIFLMGEFDYKYKDCTPLDICFAVCFDNFKPTDDYYYFDRSGSIQSTNNPIDRIDKDSIISYIITNSDDLDDWRIGSIITEWHEYIEERIDEDVN